MAAEAHRPSFLSEAVADAVVELSAEIGAFQAPTPIEQVSILGGILMEIEMGLCRSRRQVKRVKTWIRSHLQRKVVKKSIIYMPAHCRRYSRQYEAERSRLVGVVRLWKTQSLVEFSADICKDTTTSMQNILDVLQGGLNDDDDSD